MAEGEDRPISRQLASWRRHRERLLAERRAKYQQDPQYREAQRQRMRRRYHEDEAYRNATRERSRQQRMRGEEATEPGTGSA